ncbi:MAG: hypothetical protein COW63_02925 [Bacteroidetes bacterium CG18_big_fil_WC_8_21_14_2_50_41_14]|nr:MAG: hypothetical protein COW63_02925 [Bacteroidetes bacterium CG18_big_fil_WC_8_21_14_2_50_41_14]
MKLKYPSLIMTTLAILLATILNGQALYLSLNHDYDMEIQKAMYSPEFRFHTSIQAWRSSEIQSLINYDSLLQIHRVSRPTYRGPGWQKTWNKTFNDDVVSLKRPEYWFAVNPIINFDMGREMVDGKNTYINTRGLEIKGEFGKDVAIYTFVRENQADYPNYVDAWIRSNGVIPGQGKIHTILDNGFDFNNASAYIAYTPGQFFSFQLGQGKNFFGDGYRSLLLSDNAYSYPYLKLEATFWNIKYSVLYNQMMDLHNNPEGNGWDKKYTVMHYLSWAATKRLTISFFDAVVWAAQDSTGYRGFDWSYANPIIFLRSAEFSVGSPDNALMGMGASMIVGKHNVFYGQLMLDEFKFTEMTAGNGWWANKFAFQLGFKTFDAFKVKNLYLQTEFNWARPYIYTHRNVITNYGHYNQALAHPMGANFYESVSFIKYHYKRIYFSYEFQYALYGEDKNGLNYGKNIFESHTDNRPHEYDNYVGQGLSTTVIYNDLTLSYLINPAYNLNLAIGYTNRSYVNDQETINTSWFHLGLRTSLFNSYYDF